MGGEDQGKAKEDKRDEWRRENEGKNDLNDCGKSERMRRKEGRRKEGEKREEKREEMMRREMLRLTRPPETPTGPGSPASPSSPCTQQTA